MLPAATGRGPNRVAKRYVWRKRKEPDMGRAFLLWLLGVPISVIILIALFTNYI